MVCPVVGLGASAGGLEALTQVLSHLPADTGLAFVVVQHLDPHQKSLLSEILARQTQMPVREAADGVALERNHVYVIPPDTTMRIIEGRVALRQRDEQPGVAMPIDHLFRSLASDCGANAVGVVLSGTGSDGALGLQAIKGEGGISFAQEEASARFAGMPRAAIELGCVDFVLPPREIAQELTRIGQHPYLAAAADPAETESSRDDEHSLKRIFRTLRALSRVDFTHYKRPTVSRRLARRMAVHQLHALHEYADFLEATPGEARALQDDLLIRVTGFFRTPEIFESLKRSVFPRLLEGHSDKKPLRIWVPGCATGEEVYSIAICLVEYLGERSTTIPIRIFGTDLSDSAIEIARAGSYVEGIASEISPERLRRFFVKEDSRYQIAKSIREICVFAQHNVVQDPPFSRQDLVSCQNLLIYLEPVLQQRVIPSFHYALNPNGVLILGAAESIGPHSDMFTTLENVHGRVYVKKAVPTRTHYESMAEHRLPRPAERPRFGPQPSITDAARLQNEADRLALEHYAPASVLCDSELNILQFRGETRAFLMHPPGSPSLNLMKLLRPELVIELGRLVREVRERGTAVRKDRLRFRDAEGPSREVTLDVRPVQLSGVADHCLLVSFETTPHSVAAPARWPGLRVWLRGNGPLPAEQSAELEQARRELQTTRAYVKAIVEEHEGAEEELKAAQEELLSSNEEFQSTNEELETAKEELQSANEELATTNEELRHRNRELAEINIERTEARDYADAIVETMHEPLLVLDANLRLIRANRAFYEFFRTSPQLAEHGLFFELGDRQWDIPELRHVLNEVLTKSLSVRDCEVSHDFAQIGPKILRLNVRRLEWSGRILVLIAVEDITERQAALAALTDANRRKDEFLAMLAHELRNPLAAIRNGLEIWRRGDATEQTQKSAQAMLERQLQKETRLVDDLLDVSRISRGTISLRKDTVDLRQIVTQAVEELRPRIQARRHEISSSLPDAPVLIAGDATRLEQIVANLLSNSVKFTEPGGRIRIELTHHADEAMVRVTDNGIGIPPELLPAIFDLFVQAERSLDRAEGGLGLGLTLVRRLTELHGGSIEVHSRGRGHGAEFIVRLPAVRSVPPAVAAASAPTHPAVRRNGGIAPRRILIVDDSADAAESSAMLLRLDGHEIQTVFDGASALEAVPSFKPEIVLLDIGLPGLNGFEVARRLRDLPGGGQLLVVALSGYGQAQDRRQSKDAGFDQHLVKPVDSEQLSAVIASYDDPDRSGLRVQQRPD